MPASIAIVIETDEPSPVFAIFGEHATLDEECKLSISLMLAFIDEKAGRKDSVSKDKGNPWVSICKIHQS